MAFGDITQVALQTAMRGDWMRQTLLTNNIANANTPGYQREELNFDSALRTALQEGRSPAEIPLAPEMKPGAVNAEGNGVNIDRESAQLAENGLEYEAIVQVMGARNSIIKAAMGLD